MAVEVVSDGLLQLMIRRGFLEALAQIMLQVFVQLTSCHCGHEKERVIKLPNAEILICTQSLNGGTVRLCQVYPMTTVRVDAVWIAVNDTLAIVTQRGSWLQALLLQPNGVSQNQDC